ncbi:MAG: LysR family transcriptional regulator [Eubacteriales bacterium]
MEFQQLHYFLVVAKYQHMTKSAELLHIAQPALSQCIKRLEDELGTPLFDRVGKRIVLNDCGKLLQQRVRPIMAALDAIPSEIQNRSKTYSYPIRLNIEAGSMIISKILIAFQKAHPKITFQLLQNVHESECDITMSTIPYEEAEKQGDVAFTEQIYLAVPLASRFANRTSVTLDELAREKFIVLAGSKKLRVICDKLCDSVGFVPNIVFESESPLMVRELIEAGLGISFWPAYSWGEFSSDKAVLIPIGSPLCNRKLILHLSPHAVDSNVCNEFYRYVAKQLSKMQDQ